VIGSVTVRFEKSGARHCMRSVIDDARALVKLLSLNQYELSVLLTGDLEIRALNRTFRGKNRATDVLSFPQLEDWPPGGGKQQPFPTILPRPLGDVVISVDTALHQAVRMKVSLELRLRALLIHGVLHLLGYDHERSRTEARRMFARERELSAALEARDKARRAKQDGSAQAATCVSLVAAETPCAPE
jgi:probable rRNA maturation factor